MPRFRTYGKWIGALVIVLVLAQLGLPFLLQTRRMRTYLLAHLEKSFGRPVEARSFSMDILPFPRVDVEGVSINENPAFGREYFLRADRLTANVRWLGLLQGHFDFGTISLSRPSLILVRNEQGRWNLEGWLPPAQTKSSAAIAYGPQSPADSGNHLQKIEFDEGRINFKTGDEKRPFAFTNVSGSVEQMGPGRWQLRLEAQPWRSGVPLQSTGTLQVRGEVAGTSARLQPAEIQVHWGKVSIADLFRMITGNDYGVRGAFSLDGNASIGKPDSGEPAPPGAWKFSLHATAATIHRWDLTERADNPGASLNLKGLWDVAAGEAHADTLTLELPHSRFEGTARLKTAGMSDWNLRIENSGIQAQDLLAWYRAFQPGVAEALDARQLYKASFALRGFPLSWEDAQISSAAGELRLPGYSKPLRIGPVLGAAHNNFFELLPVQLSMESSRKGKSEIPPAKAAVSAATLDQLEFRLRDDFIAGKGSLRVTGKLDDAGDFFKAAAAFGQILNRGWEITGGTAGNVTREWDHGFGNGRWSGALTFSKAQLQAAGLNLPLRLDDARFEWKNGHRTATLARVGAFGASWSGSINDAPALGESAEESWKFQLHADHLDATDLDLWFGPRARPNWLQRLLPSLLGNSDSSGKPSELLRRVTAEGEIEADSLSIEKIKLAKARAHVAFHDLRLEVRDAEAEWAGGTARGGVSAVFSGPPKYEIAAEVDRADLAQFPWFAHWAEYWSGTASGKLRLTTSGVGRDALVSQLAGSGELHLKALGLHGWDVPSSMDTGALRIGSSRWDSGEGEFTIADRSLHFDSLTLENARGKTRLDGALDFSQDLKLTFAPAAAEKRGVKSVAAPRLFQLRGLLEKPVATVELTPVAQARRQQ
ncbi:MAG TPA: AsmA family protein [Candidatus Acidoferrum sp.]|nr:AsmA family protein [Candidatus Acidoferrum sp.]